MSTPTEGEQTASGVSGARLVVFLLGAVAAVVGTVLIGFAFFEPESAPCASGDMASNEFVDGRYVPRNEEFATVLEAEAFICHDVPELQAEGWSLQTIRAERSVSIERLVEGNGLGVVTLGYVGATTGRRLTIGAAPFFGPSYFESLIPALHTEEPALVQGQAATVYRFGINPDQVEVLWHEETLEHRAVAQLGEDFALDDLLQLLNTLR